LGKKGTNNEPTRWRGKMKRKKERDGGRVIGEQRGREGEGRGKLGRWRKVPSVNKVGFKNNNKTISWKEKGREGKEKGRKSGG
jgi:hypothetical protein